MYVPVARCTAVGWQTESSDDRCSHSMTLWEWGLHTVTETCEIQRCIFDGFKSLWGNLYTVTSFAEEKLPAVLVRLMARHFQGMPSLSEVPHMSKANGHPQHGNDLANQTLMIGLTLFAWPGCLSLHACNLWTNKRGFRSIFTSLCSADTVQTACYWNENESNLAETFPGYPLPGPKSAGHVLADHCILWRRTGWAGNANHSICDVQRGYCHLHCWGGGCSMYWSIEALCRVGGGGEVTGYVRLQSSVWQSGGTKSHAPFPRWSGFCCVCCWDFFYVQKSDFESVCIFLKSAGADLLKTTIIFCARLS